jgi:hypothetical protein
VSIARDDEPEQPRRKLPTVSAAQRRALLAVADDGVVTGSEATVRALVRNGILTDPTYAFGRVFARGATTPLGRSVIERLRSQR